MLKLRALTGALFFIFGFTAASLASAATVVHAGHLFDTASGKMLEKRSVVIEAGRITNVEAGFIGGEGDEIIDLSSSYVSPGFMDMHVHLDGELNPPASYSEEFFMNSADIALRSSIFAKRTLDAGFTTVRDLGAGDIQAIFALRDAIAKGISTDLGFLPRVKPWPRRADMGIPPTEFVLIYEVIPVQSRVSSTAPTMLTKQYVSDTRMVVMWSSSP